MRLYIYILCAEKLLGSFSGKFLYLVHALAAAIVSSSRISLSVLIGENASIADITAGLTQFSEAISSMWLFWRSNSSVMALAIS